MVYFFLKVRGNLGENISVPEFENEILKSKNGFFITWDELHLLAEKFELLISIFLIGSKKIELIKRYEDDRESYESCDIVIEFVDSAFWLVFSKDEQLINRLAAKFKDIELLESDYQDKYYENQ